MVAVLMARDFITPARYGLQKPKPKSRPFEEVPKHGAAKNDALRQAFKVVSCSLAVAEVENMAIVVRKHMAPKSAFL